MKRALLVLALALPLHAQDLAQWNRVLAADYNPAYGMDYRALKARDLATVQSLRQQLAKVNVAALDRKSQLAHWINVYNVNVVATILENYPVDSIRDISTDPIIRLNVFKKERVPVGNVKVSLDSIENEKIRQGFHDPRIHFAINCAAKSCPPIRMEAFTGAKLDAQLDGQARAFLNGPHGARFSRDGDTLVITTTKIMDWFSDDFQQWAGGKAAFIRRYVAPDKQRLIDGAKKIEFEFDDYDWDLNDWRRVPARPAAQVGQAPGTRVAGRCISAARSLAATAARLDEQVKVERQRAKVASSERASL